MVYKILEVCHSHIHVYRFNFFRDRSIQTANNFAKICQVLKVLLVLDIHEIVIIDQYLH